MTASVPNGFSTEDLQAMLDSAPKEDDMHKPAEDENSSKEELIMDAADKALDSIDDELQGPVVHKVIAMKVITQMIMWHTSYGKHLMEDGQTDTGVAWLRDAGKFQAILSLLQDMTVGPDDFTCEE